MKYGQGEIRSGGVRERNRQYYGFFWKPVVELVYRQSACSRGMNHTLTPAAERGKRVSSQAGETSGTIRW